MKAFDHQKKRDYFVAMRFWSSPVSNWPAPKYVTTLPSGFLFSAIITQRNITSKGVLLSFRSPSGLDHLCMKPGKKSQQKTLWVLCQKLCALLLTKVHSELRQQF